MDWKIFFLLFVVFTIAVCENDDDNDSDDNYDVKKFHIQGRQAGSNPHCIVSRRRRSIQTQRKNFNDSPTLTSVTGSPIQIVTGHQMIQTPEIPISTGIGVTTSQNNAGMTNIDNGDIISPTGNIAATTSPTGTGIISPTVTATGTPTGTAKPINHVTATATDTASPTGTDTASPTDTGSNAPEEPNRGSKYKYNKKYQKIRDNKRISKIDDDDVENIGTGIDVGTNTKTKTNTGTRTATSTLTKTGTGLADQEPTINCIIVNRPTPAPAQGLFGNFNLFGLRRRRSLRNIRNKFGLNI